MIRQLEIPLFDHLQDAISSPEDVSLLALLQEFDATIASLEDRVCLEIAGDAIVQLAAVFEAKHLGLFQEIAQVKAQVNTARNEPVVPVEFFDRFVRQSMVVNFAPFIEPIPMLQLPDEDRDWDWALQTDFHQMSESAMVQTVLDVMIDDAAALLDALPDLNAEQKLDAIKELSHGEEIESWTTELVASVEQLQRRKSKPVSFLDLICTLEISRGRSKRKSCLIDLWLAFLLGKHEYQLHRTAHDFYSTVGIEVCAKSAFQSTSTSGNA